MLNNSDFRTSLRAFLEKKGMTQSELADLLGISQAAVSQLTNPKVDKLQRICEVLNCRIEIDADEVRIVDISTQEEP